MRAGGVISENRCEQRRNDLNKQLYPSHRQLHCKLGSNDSHPAQRRKLEPYLGVKRARVRQAQGRYSGLAINAGASPIGTFSGALN